MTRSISTFAVVALLAGLLWAPPADAKRRRRKQPPPPPAWLDANEAALVAELTALRRRPRDYAVQLEQLRGRYDGTTFRLGPGKAVRTHEGVAALDEAVKALREGKRRLPKLKLSRGMSAAARDHLNDIGASGSTAHVGADGSTAGARLYRYGDWKRRNAELLSFGWRDAKDVVAWLLIDDGLAARSRRNTLLDKQLKAVGVACGPHKAHQAACVIVLADRFKAAKGRREAPPNRNLEVFVTE